MPEQARPRVFISYSHADEEWLTRLLKFLEPELGEMPDVWHDRRIEAGDVWSDEIQQALHAARVAVLLVSSDFLASDFIKGSELPPLLESANRGECRIFWIPVRPSAWETIPGIEKHQAGHSPGRPLSTMDQPEWETALVEICKKIARIVKGEAEPPADEADSASPADEEPAQVFPSASAGASAEFVEPADYSSLTLRFHAEQGGAFPTELTGETGDPTPPAPISLDPALLEDRLWEKPDPVTDPRTGVDAALPSKEAARAVGAELYRALAESQFGPKLQEGVAATDYQSNEGLRVVLNATEAPEIAQLPWEFTYDAEEGFLFRQPLVPLVRKLDVRRPRETLKVEPPLRLLVAVASPEDQPGLLVGDELRRLDQQFSDLRAQGYLLATMIDHATRRSLEDGLDRQRPHILHFIGHGGFVGREGAIFLESEETPGATAPLEASELGYLLQSHLQTFKQLRLVVLNSCLGAAVSPSNPIGSVAHTLVKREIPAVVAMQFPISNRGAIRLAESFYRRLAVGVPVDAALAAARSSLGGVEWGAAALYMQTSDGELFDIAPAEPVTPVPPPPAPEPRKLSRKGLIAAGAVLLVLLLTAAAYIFRGNGDSASADAEPGAQTSDTTTERPADVALPPLDSRDPVDIDRLVAELSDLSPDQIDAERESLERTMARLIEERRYDDLKLLLRALGVLSDEAPGDDPHGFVPTSARLIEDAGRRADAKGRPQDAGTLANLLLSIVPGHAWALALLGEPEEPRSTPGIVHLQEPEPDAEPVPDPRLVPPPPPSQPPVPLHPPLPPAPPGPPYPPAPPAPVAAEEPEPEPEPERNRRWTLHFSAVSALASDDTSTATGRTELTVDDGLGVGVGAEYRFSDRIGLDLGLFFSELDAESRLLGVVPTIGEDDVEMRLLTAGPSFHLTPRRHTDVYVGPLVALVRYERLFGEEVDDELAWGAQAGVDIPLGYSRWALNFAARYLRSTLDAETFELDIDPLIVSVGLSYSF